MGVWREHGAAAHTPGPTPAPPARLGAAAEGRGWGAACGGGGGDTAAAGGDEARAWHGKQLERMLVDHMLRGGYYEAAAQLASTAGLELLVDSLVFVDARRVVDALQQHDCAPALAWCASHAPRLKKLKSTLEFMLHRVQFLALVQQQQHMRAIHYARTHLARCATRTFPQGISVSFQ